MSKKLITAPTPNKRRPRLSAAYESKNIKERRPRVLAQHSSTTMGRLIEASSDWIVGAKLKNKYGTTQSKPASEMYSPVSQCLSLQSEYISLFCR